MGDGGERPSFQLSYRGISNRRWNASASSFYDGGGDAEHEDPVEAVKACLDELRNHPERERERERQAAVHALARHLHVSHARAGEIIDGLAP